MGYTSFISYLDVRRPLVFLCGPAYRKDDPLDRRFILRRYINRHWVRINENDKDYINAFPIVVDELFSPDDIRTENLNIRISVIEEIISNIAYRTYIFLDTMSTSYELGQFTNFAYNLDSVSTFVDNQYEKRTNNVVGGYIKESFQQRLIQYQASYDNRGHIFFPSNKKGKPEIPKEIVSILERDNPINNSNLFLQRIKFSTNIDDINNPGVILCKKDQNKLNFSFSIKNLFYYVSSVYRRTKRNGRIKLDKMPPSIDSEVFLSFYKELEKELLASFVCCTQTASSRSYLISPDFSISISVGNIGSLDLIYHMLYISFMISNYKGNKSYVVSDKDAKNQFEPEPPEGLGFPNSEVDMLNIRNKHLEKIITNHNNQFPRRGIVEKTLKIKNKTRKIVAYSNDFYGKGLKYIHKEVFESFLRVLPSSSSSYAYKEKCNTLMCLEQHKGNQFFAKFDIHKYFESISMALTINKICSYVVMQYNNRFNKIFYHYKIKTEIGKDISFLIRPLFHKYRLPIGFVTSPKISDFYLFSLDEEMLKVPNVVYTRYADDILLSSSSEESLNEGIKALKSLLTKENLLINYKKTRFMSLTNEGDSVRFLGINMVKRKNDKYEFTISRKYIVETSRLFCDYILKKPTNRKTIDLEVIQGRFNYIRSISQKSLCKLKKMIEIKLTEKGIGIPIELHQIFLS